MTMQTASGLLLFTAMVHVTLVACVTNRFFRHRTPAERQFAFGSALSPAQTASQVSEEDIQLQLADE